MLSKQYIVWAVWLGLLAAYVKWAGLQVLKDPEHLAAVFAKAEGSKTREPVFIFLGRLVVFIITGAYAFIFGQSVLAAIKRYRYRPLGVPALEPLSEEERRAQQAATSNTPTGQQGPGSQQQRQQQQQQERRNPSPSDHDERRRRALEALQKDLDEKAAALKEKQRQAEAERAARAAAAAAAKAAKETEASAAQQAATAVQQAQWERWEQTMMPQPTWGPSVTVTYIQLPANAAAAGSSAAGAAAAGAAGASAAAVMPPPPPPPSSMTDQQLAELQQDRMIRAEQDAEFHASLAADAAKQRQRQQQVWLKAFRAALQEQLPPEAAAGSPDGLAIRVRLQDGSSAVRQFAGAQSFADVMDWVYSLPGMPLLVPGRWLLASSFPKRQLQAAEGLWAPGGYTASQDPVEEFLAAGSSLGLSHSELGYELAAADSFSLTIRPLSGAAFTVQVAQGSSILDVKRKVQRQTGAAPEKQRLIFAGQVLADDDTLKHYNISSEHTVQLAVRMGDSSGGGGGGGGSGGGAEPAAAAAAEAGAGSSDAAGEDVLAVSDVAQLKEVVAHGASQLALYVVECG